LVYRKRLSQEVADKSLNRFFTDSWFLMEIMAGQINIRESSLADAHSLVQLDFPVRFEYTIYNSKSVSTNLALGIAANVRLNEPDISPNLIGNNYLGWSLFADLNAWNATISRLDLRVGLRYNFILQKVLERFPSNYASFYLSAGIRD
ncbi:MAG: hypothetical protein KDC44_13045, partial [Phaeodactylibacter sp.]|nr:hypothetical protein [Phaeodactylibacter sp.]